MGKIDSNFSRSKPQRQSSLLTNLIIPDSPKPTTNSTTSPSSPADEIFYDALEGFIDNVAEEVLDDVLEEVFYDALEDFGEDVELQLPDKPRLTNVLRTSIAFEHETASNTPSIPPLFPSTTSTSTFTTSVINTGFSRNSSKPTTSLTTRGNSSVLPFATQTQADFARSTAPIPISSSVPAPRSPQKKAVLIGLNYERCGKKDLRLRHATRDAWRFATTLTKLGYSKDNMKVVTDEEGQRFPSFDYLIECLDWLVQDVSDGDCLFFMFSGHCDPPKPGKPEPHLVAADLMAIPRSTFQEHLVTKVPAGAELTIVLDCCNAAGMVKLKYCIGRMGSRYEITRTDESRALSELGQSAVSPSRGAPQHGSLLGLKGLGQQARVHPQARPVEVGLGAYGTPASIPPRRNHHVATGRPLPITAPSQAPIPHVIIGSSPHSAPLRLPPAQRRQPVFEGRPQFKEPSAGLVSPAGKVVVWAGTGERQLAFEASGGVQNSVFSNAICDVLDTCPKSPVTHGDVWRSVVGAVDRENSWRSERDAKKAVKPAPNLRVQHAQLWVSQEEKPSSPSFLDQLVY